jgi:hypothetical protein
MDTSDKRLVVASAEVLYQDLENLKTMLENKKEACLADYGNRKDEHTECKKYLETIVELRGRTSYTDADRVTVDRMLKLFNYDVLHKLQKLKDDIVECSERTMDRAKRMKYRDLKASVDGIICAPGRVSDVALDAADEIEEQMNDVYQERSEAGDDLDQMERDQLSHRGY